MTTIAVVGVAPTTNKIYHTFYNTTNESKQRNRLFDRYSKYKRSCSKNRTISLGCSEFDYLVI
jgi:hypothetical protein